MYLCPQEEFERQFGQSSTIPQPTDTRWNSLLVHLKVIHKLNQTKLNNALIDSGNTPDILSTKVCSQLSEIIKVLQPFYEVTKKTEADQVSHLF